MYPAIVRQWVRADRVGFEIYATLESLLVPELRRFRQRARRCAVARKSERTRP